LDYRAILTREGIVNGFQWLGGSFMEEIEKLESRPPNDLDVVSFLAVDLNVAKAAISRVPLLFDRAATKRDYHLDHFPVDAAFHPFNTVDLARYWFGLFSHRRNAVWRGLLRVELNCGTEDQAARQILDVREMTVPA